MHVLQILHGRLFIHAGPSTGLRPAYIRYLNPLPAEPAAPPDSEDEDSKSSDIEYESPLKNSMYGRPEVKEVGWRRGDGRGGGGRGRMK